METHSNDKYGIEPHANLPPNAPVPKLFSIFAEKFRIDRADSLKGLIYDFSK